MANERDLVERRACEYFANVEHEFYTALAYSGYKHAIRKQEQLLADFAIKIRDEALAARDVEINNALDVAASIISYGGTNHQAVGRDVLKIIRDQLRHLNGGKELEAEK